MPPWTSLEDFDDVPEAKSSRSISAVRRPREAASRATPAPVMPPPTTTTSNVPVRSAESASDRWNGAGCTRAVYEGAWSGTPGGADTVWPVVDHRAHDGVAGLVSVVVPAYRREAAIGAAIRSVTTQTYRDLETVVVDDGSPDGTADVVAALAADDRRIRLLRFPENQGRSAARNAGMDAATGEFVTFLDSDDLYA